MQDVGTVGVRISGLPGSAMNTVVIPAAQWRAALGLLHDGRVVGLPTDTVYGIGAMPLNASAIDSIYEAKERPSDKALPMLVASTADARRIADLGDAATCLCAAFWPGALTLVAMAAPTFLSPALAEDGTVALRMPDLDLALELIAGCGGVLAVTSANLSGTPPATSADAVLTQLGGRIAAVIDAGPSRSGVASTVVRVVGDDIEVLREGGISESAIRRALASSNVKFL